MIRIVRVELRAPKADIGEAWSNRRKQLRYVKGPPGPRSAVLWARLFCPRLRQSTETILAAHSTRVGAAQDLAGLDN
jgi:hypothetical protein